MSGHGDELESWYFVTYPVLLAIVVAALVLYVTHSRLGLNFWFALGLSTLVSIIWVRLCSFLLTIWVTRPIPEEAGLVGYCCVIFAALLALALWQFRLRLAVAIPVAALSSSIWFLAVWFSTVRKYLR